MTTESGLWCQQRIEVTLRGPETDIAQTFDTPYVRVGSASDADLVLPVRDDVPTRCAYLHATDDGVYAVDLREEAVARFGGWLTDDSEITIGPYRLSAQLAASSSGSSGDRLDLQAKQDTLRVYPKLRVVLNGQAVANVRLRRRLTVVGHRRPSTLRIINKHISACHCVLYWDGDDVWIVDLLSANRSRIDDRMVQAAHFPAGSRLGIHRVALEYLGLADTKTDPISANASDDSDVPLRASTTSSGSVDTAADLPQASDANLVEETHWPQERHRLQQRLDSRQAEIDTLCETLRDERERWKTLASDRERELEEAAAAVQSAVQSLESQRHHFEEQSRVQADEADRRLQQLDQRIQTLSQKIHRQEELLARAEDRIKKGLADVENACRSLDHSCSTGEEKPGTAWPPRSTQERVEVAETGMHDAPETEHEPEEQPLAAIPDIPDVGAVAAVDTAAAFDAALSIEPDDLPEEPNEAKRQADKLSYEVCDRLVLRERSAVRRMQLIIAGLMVIVAAAGAAGVYVYHWLR